MKKILWIPAFLFLTSVVYAQSIQLSTYYPSPFGKYDRIQLVPRPALGTPCDSGTMYIDNGTNQVMLCDAAGTAWAPLVASGSWTEIGNTLYATNTNANVGLGTTTPTSRLHVNAPEGDAPPGVFLESADISVNGGADGQFALRNNSASGTRKIFLGGPGSAYALTVDAQAGNVGIGTTTPRTKLELGNDGAILAAGTYGSGWTEPQLGAGTRLLWYPRRGAFRAGYVDGTQWNDTNMADGSVAMGVNTVANGLYSTALGASTTASGNYSTAMGSGTTASGDYSTAMGWNSTASGVVSKVMGMSSIANAPYATAMGVNTTASANSSTAMGMSTIASGASSTAMGLSTTASGNASTAMGNSTTASGRESTAMGWYARANGDFSTAMGYDNVALAYASVVLGRYNVMTGNAASWVDTDPLFVIGNGLNAVSPSNAMTVLKNGNVGIGSTTPSSRLHVVGNASDVDFIVQATNTQIVDIAQFKDQSGTNLVRVGASGEVFMQPNDPAVIPLEIRGVTSQTADILRVKDVVQNPLLFVKPSGNIGIGTAAPGARLEVAGGAIKATGGLIIQTCINSNIDCPTAPPLVPANGQMWLCTDIGDATPCNGI